MSKPTKNYLTMTPQELAEETATFDAGAIPPGKPLSTAARAKWERAKAGGSASLHLRPGRPKVGEGAIAVPVSVEAGLLRRAVAKATALGMKRSEFFAKALQLLTDGRTDFGGKVIETSARRGSMGNSKHEVPRKKKTRAVG